MTQAGAKPALLFDLTLNDEQRITRETMQRFAETVIKPQTRQIDESSQMSVDLLQQAHELGITLLPVPEDLGGAGSPRSPVSNVLIAEDLGKGDMGVALHILAPLGFVNLLIDQGSEAQKAKYLPIFAGESFVPATVAISEPRATSDVHALQTKAVKDGGAFVLNGVKGMVPLATTAEHFAIIAEVDGEGPQTFLVEKGAQGLTTEAQDYLGLHALGLGLVKLENVRVDASAKLGEGEKTFDYQRLIDLSHLGACAAALGTAQALLEHVTQYANERIAFGEPISHRQAVAFMVANIAIELDGMRLMVWRAAAQAENGLDFHRQAHLTYINCAERMMQVGTDGVQILGGAGFLREYFEEMWYRNLRGLAVLEGCFNI